MIPKGQQTLPAPYFPRPWASFGQKLIQQCFKRHYRRMLLQTSRVGILMRISPLFSPGQWEVLQLIKCYRVLNHLAVNYLMTAKG